ncbi:uncharacterized protein [Macrobrachium rosenbergii]|uniref:uncharacterized protein n=1 Tax=Macrobrachium rosenbergii TaxID=79674 RepID=UPI0034D5A8F2
MQLDQILSAAVAAVNEVQQLPSPDVPQYSPTSPSSSCAAHEQQQAPTLPLKYETAEPEESTTDLHYLNQQAQAEQQGAESKAVKFPNASAHQSEMSCAKNAFHVYNEALHEVQDNDGFGDISFFALDDDNLVITSQQALEMFETKPDEYHKQGAYSYEALGNKETPPEINTPPIDMTVDATANDEMSEQQVSRQDEGGRVPTEIANEEHSTGGAEAVDVSSAVLGEWPVFLEDEIPVTNGLQVTEVTEEVPVISSEVEVLTSLDEPQYTSLTPAVTEPPQNDLGSLSDQVLQSLPGSTLDATVDENGRFVVQVVGPGMNMTVQNNYISREKVAPDDSAFEQQMKPSNLIDFTNPHRDSPLGMGPYATFDEHVPMGASAKDMSVTQTSPDMMERPRSDTKRHSSVLTALRDSIYRSRAKKRPFDDHTSYGDRSSAKRRPADILKDLYIDCERQDRGVSLQESHYPQRNMENHMGENPTARAYSPRTRGSFKSPTPEVRSPNEILVLRPEELQSALAKKRQKASPPLMIMRPDDLKAEGEDETNDPLQVQLVYLVYPMDGSGASNSGSQRNRMPSEMIYSNQGFPRDMPNVALQLPTASAKKVPWLHDEDSIGPHPTNPTRNDIDNDLGYKDKLIEEWNHQDVIYYMFDSAKELNFAGQHLNFYELNAVTGKDLCQMTRDDFKRFAPKAADHLFQNFRARLLQEKRQQQQVAAHATSSHQDINKNRIVPEATSPFDFINQSKSFFSPANHNLSHHHPAVQPQQPAVIFRDSPVGCDASARYEIRYETVDGRAIGLDDGNNKRLILGSLPSASRKSFDLLHAPSPAAPFEVDENISDPDQSSNEEEVVKPEPPKKRGPGRPRKPENELKKKRKKTGRLWEFIRNLLLDPETCPSLVRWDDPEQGVFRFVQADKVAQRWGQRKQNRDMNYEKLSRAMRYYYKGGVFEPVIGRRLVYKFGKNAKGWRPSNPNFTNQCPSLPPPPPPPPHSSSH